MLGGCGGRSSAAGTYVVPGMHFEHCLLSAGRCRDPRHLNAKHSSSVISAHSDWCGTGTALCKTEETDHFKILLGSGSYLLASYCQGLNSIPVQFMWDCGEQIDTWTGFSSSTLAFPICMTYNIYNNKIFHPRYYILISHSIFRHSEKIILSKINICRLLSISM